MSWAEDAKVITSDSKLRAYCFGDGSVHFDVYTPARALPIATKPDAISVEAFKKRIIGFCRRGHAGVYLVPGIPEAENEEEALRKLKGFVDVVHAILGMPE